MSVYPRKLGKITDYRTINTILTTKSLKLMLPIAMAAEFISGNTPLIAQLCHHLDHSLKCAVRTFGRETRTSFLPTSGWPTVKLNFFQGFPGEFLPNFQGFSWGFSSILLKTTIIKYRSSAYSHPYSAL